MNHDEIEFYKVHNYIMTLAKNAQTYEPFNNLHEMFERIVMNI